MPNYTAKAVQFVLKKQKAVPAAAVHAVTAVLSGATTAECVLNVQWKKNCTVPNVWTVLTGLTPAPNAADVKTAAVIIAKPAKCALTVQYPRDFTAENVKNVLKTAVFPYVPTVKDVQPVPVISVKTAKCALNVQ